MRDLELRIDLKEFQETDKFLPIKNILPYSKKYIDITELSDEGIKIRTRNYVGIIKLSYNCILTIEPKVPVEDFLYLLYKSQGKKELIKELEDILEAGRKKLKDYPNIFDFLLYLLLSELDKVKNFGFLKSSVYFRDTNKVKGKILINDTLKNWYKGNSKITCGYFLQSKDNPENQAIKFTLWMILNIYSDKILDELRNEFFNKYKWFQDVPLTKIDAFLETVENDIAYKKLPNSRNYYYDILNICMFFITNSSIEFKASNKFKVKSFVFNMNKVFEDYIYQVLKEKIEKPISIERYYKMKLFDNTRSF